LSVIESPLALAEKSHNFDILEILIEAGARIEVTDKQPAVGDSNFWKY
tara:strand:+ start:457 stop:600 length:144 start_codon:yes stop_codon:yes gene_type:complete